MRLPNPPPVMLDNLTPDQQRKVIRLALLVVAELAAGRDWAAFEMLDTEMVELEEKMALWSLLDSQQRSTIKSLSDAARKP
jgi:hypothetical protein